MKTENFILIVTILVALPLSSFPQGGLVDNNPSGGFLLLSGNGTPFPDEQSVLALSGTNHLLWDPHYAAFRAGREWDFRWKPMDFGNFSFVFGEGSAKGKYSFAFGGTYYGDEDQHLEADGDYSFAFGKGAVSTGNHSLAFGFRAEAIGDHSIAFGGSAYANYSIAMGWADATGIGSIALGRTQASGYRSVSIGYDNEAQGDYSMAFGRGLISLENEYVIGEYNEIDYSTPDEISTGTDGIYPLFIVGVGINSPSSYRKNGFVVFTDGSASFNGALVLGKSAGDISMGTFE